MSEIKETVAQEAKRLLSEVPAENFIKQNFTDGVEKCCAVGHYKRLKSGNVNDYSYENCNDFTENRLITIPDGTRYIGCELRENSLKFLNEKYSLIDLTISNVNNVDSINGYNQPEIKDRVMALLDDMVEAGY